MLATVAHIYTENDRDSKEKKEEEKMIIWSLFIYDVRPVTCCRWKHAKVSRSGDEGNDFAQEVKRLAHQPK